MGVVEPEVGVEVEVVEEVAGPAWGWVERLALDAIMVGLPSNMNVISLSRMAIEINAHTSHC